jgi:uncharacterized SAM-binding protein YcdF (DUF218 family)
MSRVPVCVHKNDRHLVAHAHALHMLRAKRQFSGTGLEVIPAPTDFSSAVTLRRTDFWPSAEDQETSQSALREIFGLAGHRLRQVLTASR